MKKQISLTYFICLLWLGTFQAQDNTVDLRYEINESTDNSYYNLIYARVFGPFMAEAYFVGLPLADYTEFVIGLGYTPFSLSDIAVYATAHYSIATDDNYFEPGLFLLDIDGSWTGSLWGVYYVPLGDAGIAQILIDPIEVQYNFIENWSAGISGYIWKAEGLDWNFKFGPKLSIADKFGATEFRAAKWNEAGGGGWDFQLRRLFIF